MQPLQFLIFNFPVFVVVSCDVNCLNCLLIVFIIIFCLLCLFLADRTNAVSYTHLRAHETGRNLVCRLLLEKNNV